jgi:ElaB/YqjD/DUF883 family membrane-anchored ribosome-binding protein
MAAANTKANEELNRAKEEAGKGVDRTRDAADKGMDRMRDAAGHAGQALSEAASAAGSALSSAASTVGHKAEDVTSSVGTGLQSLGEKVREKGPDHGLLGKGKEAVAGAMEQTGKYIEDRNLGGMAEDVTNIIRRNPIPALLVCVGLGFLIGQLVRR